MSTEERKARALAIASVVSGLEVVEAISLLCLCVTTLWGMSGCSDALLARTHLLLDELAVLERKKTS